MVTTVMLMTSVLVLSVTLKPTSVPILNAQMTKIVDKIVNAALFLILEARVVFALMVISVLRGESRLEIRAMIHLNAALAAVQLINAIKIILLVSLKNVGTIKTAS